MKLSMLQKMLMSKHYVERVGDQRRRRVAQTSTPVRKAAR